MTPFLQVADLVRHFGDVRAVDGLTFTLERGQSVGLIGANGAGKTTLMRLLTTLDLPDAGSIVLDGTDAIAAPERVRSRIGWMPDTFTPLPHMTVQDTLDFFARAYGLTGTYRLHEVKRVMDFCGIRELADRFISKLSKGQAQRVALARTIIGDPELLVLDEPAAGLDPAARLEFMSFVRSLQKQGKTLLISSHILSELAEMCDTMLFMDAGKLLRSGTLAELSGQEDRQFRIELATDEAEALMAWLKARGCWSSVMKEGANALTARFTPAEQEADSASADAEPTPADELPALPPQAAVEASVDEAIAQELRAMVAAFPVMSFARCRRRLEETFVSLLRERQN